MLNSCRNAWSPLRLLLFSVALLGALNGCDSHRETNAESGLREGILYIGNGDDPASLDIHRTTGYAERNIFTALYEGLTRLDSKTLEVLPGVASHWQVSEDGLRYRFFLRDSARWSNGDRVTAGDFVFAWQRILSAGTGAAYASELFCIQGAEAFHQGTLTDFSNVGVKAMDDTTLDVVLAFPVPYFLSMLDQFYFYPLHSASMAADDAAAGWTLPGRLVSNGMFMLQEWQVASHVKVVRNPYYWQPETIRLNAVVFRHIADKIIEEQAFRSGQIHLTNTPTMAIEKMSGYRQKQPGVFRSDPMYAVYYYLPNPNRKPFDDPKVRRALALSLDRQTLVERITKGGEKPAYSFVPPLPSGYQPQELLGYDPEQARRLLAEAGYPNGDGFPEFELLMVGEQLAHNLAVAIQQMWKQELNIHMTLRREEWKVYLQTRKLMQFDVRSGVWFADNLDPTNFLNLLHSGSAHNLKGWHNADYDALLETINHTVNAEERYRLFDQAGRIIAEQSPVFPLFFPVNTNLVRPEVRNWYQNAAGISHYQNVGLEAPL